MPESPRETWRVWVSSRRLMAAIGVRHLATTQQLLTFLAASVGPLGRACCGPSSRPAHSAQRTAQRERPREEELVPSPSPQSHTVHSPWDGNAKALVDTSAQDLRL